MALIFLFSIISVIGIIVIIWGVNEIRKHSIEE